jgi:hypothetical protein
MEHDFLEFVQYLKDLPEPTLATKVYWTLRTLPKNILWWFKWRFIPKHRYHIPKTGPFLTPGYCDPCVRIQVVMFEETYQFVRNVAKFGYGGRLSETDEELWERTKPNQSWFDEEKKFREHTNSTWDDLEKIADWWEVRRKLKDFYLDSDFEGEYIKKLEKADNTIDEMTALVAKHINFLWYA